ncbi:MAG: hypothetical protein D6784_12405 [Chloroflexi bacterium]|nr:MAG: hypothetical protein D6784_12405 [Chloroflexota bacterium]
MKYARRQMQAQNWAEAVRGFRFALGEFPLDREAIIGFGRANLELGQVKIAQKAAEQVLKLNPADLDGLQLLAQVQEHSEQVEAAAETHFRIGNILSAEGRLGEAVEAWRCAVALSPTHIDAHQKLAEGLARQERVQEAVYTYLSLAALFQQQDNLDEAALQLEKASALTGEDDPVITAAFDALRQGEKLDPAALVERSMLAGEESEPLVEPDETGQYPAFTDTFFTEDLRERDEDPFGIWEELARQETGKGLLQAAQEDALSRLANIIFDLAASEQSGDLAIDEVNTLIVQAMDFQRRQELEAAVEKYQQVLAHGVSTPALCLNLGLILIELGRHDEAIKMLNVALEAREYWVAANFALGRACFALSQTEPAVKHFVEAVKLVDLETVDTHTAANLARDYHRFLEEMLSEHDQAKINDFITSLNRFFSRPDWEKRVYEARRRMNSVTRNGSGSVMTLAEYLESPETEAVITALAKTGEYVRKKMLLTASEECLRAIERAPSALLLHIRLGDILLQQDRPEAAIEKYLTVARVYRIRHQTDKAIEIYKKILRLAPMDITVRSALIDLYINTQHLEEALEQYVTLANSYYQLAQVNKALEKYQEALNLADQSSNKLYWQAEILRSMGDIYNQRFDWGGATQAFEQLLEIQPDDETVRRQLVDLYFKQRQSDKAIKMLDSFLDHLLQQNRGKQALELLKELASSYPDELEIRKRLAEVYARNGMKDRAIAEYDALGELQLERGLRHEAIKTIEKILALGPEDVEGYQLLLAQISGKKI